ncbi:hypothetical protein G6L37_05535 [Agrobacterium rubi]|nr:hypothetical protein [Agrobacterium rubi]NTF24820.1 hypothetical protein [Agrobacterium rubi]
MPKIRPLRDIANVSPASVMLGVSATNAPRAVYDVVDMAVTVAGEMMWPSLLEAARKLKLSPIEDEGWRLRPYSKDKRWNEYFILEEMGGHGGYLFNMRLRPRKTDAALERLAEMMRSDVNMGSSTAVDSFLNPADGLIDLNDDPQSYLPEDHCHEIEHLVCCAFSTDGVPPSGFNDEGMTPFELATISAIGPDPVGHMPGRIFAFHPSPFVGIDEMPDVPVSRSVDDIGASVSVLSRLGRMLARLDLSHAVRRRAADLGTIAYQHYWSQDRGPLLELAAVSVYRDGGMIGGATTSSILQVWSHACSKIAAASAIPVSSVIRVLRDAGHVDPEGAYAAYGDLLHVEDGRDGEGALAVRTSVGAYRIDFVTDEDGMVSDLDLVLADEVGAARDDGHLGSYRFAPDATLLSHSVSEDEFFRGNVLRALNDLAGSVAMASDALAEDCTRRYMFSY